MLKCLRSYTILLTYTHRFPEPEVLFQQILKILRDNRGCVKWLTDQGADEVDDEPQYLLFRRALETSLRNVARSGSRLFKKGDMLSRFNWEKADPWRKHRCIIFLIRYFLVRTHTNLHEDTHQYQ